LRAFLLPIAIAKRFSCCARTSFGSTIARCPERGCCARSSGLAKTHSLAAARGVEVERIQDEHREAVSRRRFIQGAGAVAATAALSRATIARAAAPRRIAVVGGGIAGMSAALQLAYAGVASTVYEASGRIGGRMYSNTSYWNEGQVSEWGGELVDTDHKTVPMLAKRFNLPTADLLAAEPNSSEDTYYFGGQYYPAAQANTDFKPVHNALQGDVQSASYPTLYNLSTAGGQRSTR
jgi:monoamine oxidase